MPIQRRDDGLDAHHSCSCGMLGVVTMGIDAGLDARVVPAAVGDFAADLDATAM
jgi:hypothetical protein